MSHGLSKRLPDRSIATSKIVIYIMHFPILQNGLTSCFNVSILLICFDQYFVYQSICPDFASFNIPNYD